MADIVLMCVREDIERAEALAETFDAFGFSVSGSADDDGLRTCATCVVIWSVAASASPIFVAAAQRALETRKGVVLSLSHAQAFEDALFCFDLTDWNGDPDDELLDHLFFTLDRMVIAARPARPIAAGSTETDEPVVAPAQILPRLTPAPAPALRAIATSLFVIGAALAAGLAIGGARADRAPAQATVVRMPVEHVARVALADASAPGLTYDLAAVPVNDAPVGHRGLEPPSAPRTR
jgi:hypothetical protein